MRNFKRLAILPDLLCAVCVAMTACHIPQKGTEATSQPSEQPVTKRPPPSSGHSFHAIELLGRPYEDRGKMITVDAWSIPNSFYEGRILSYEHLEPKNAMLSGMVGVRYNRKIKGDVLLYDVMAVNPQGDFMEGTDIQAAGQIAIQMSAPDLSPDPFQSWDVEPLGTLEGTTDQGLVIRIPFVRFWRYHVSGLDAAKPVEVVIPPQQYEKYPSQGEEPKRAATDLDRQILSN